MTGDQVAKMLEMAAHDNMTSPHAVHWLRGLSEVLVSGLLAHSLESDEVNMRNFMKAMIDRVNATLEEEGGRSESLPL